MKKSKTYYTKNGSFTFDIVKEEEVTTNVCYGICRENGKSAWLDNLGLQFEGEDWIQASQKPNAVRFTRYISYEHDPLYPDDSIEMTRFWNTAEEAKAYRDKVNQECPDVCVELYEVRPI